MSEPLWGHADLHRRTILEAPSRRKCKCGCGGRSTHVGLANGIGMTTGCEWAVRVWVRDGTPAILRRTPTRAEAGAGEGGAE